MKSAVPNISVQSFGISLSYSQLAADDELEEGKAPHQMLGTIGWKIRQLLALQESQRKRQPLPNDWKRTPEMKRRTVLRTLKKHPLEADKIFSQLQKSNRLFNSARVGDRKILELLVLELCSS